MQDWQKEYEGGKVQSLGTILGHEVRIHYLKNGPTFRECMALFHLFQEDDLYQSLQEEWKEDKDVSKEMDEKVVLTKKSEDNAIPIKKSSEDTGNKGR